MARIRGIVSLKSWQSLVTIYKYNFTMRNAVPLCDKYPNNAPPASFPLQHRPRNPFHIVKCNSYPQVIHRSASKLSTFAQVGFISHLRSGMFVIPFVILT